MMTSHPFSYFDPLLLLPEPPRCGLLVGPSGDSDAMAQGYGRFERIADLSLPGPASDAVVALEWQEPVARLAAGAQARLQAQGVLLARLANRQLPALVSRRLYPDLEHRPGTGTTLEELQRGLAAASFAEHEVYCCLPSDSFPFVAFPVHERRMQRFYLEHLLPKWGLKGRIFSQLGGMLPPWLLSPYFLILARKGG